MRLSNQGQILDSKAGVGSVKLYVKKKKNTLSLDFNSEIAGKFNEGREQKSENARILNDWFFSGLFAMQNISGKCFLGICLEAQQYFFCSCIITYYSVFLQ